MRALVVYESMFGCTRDVAAAIGRGAARGAEVEVVDVGAAGAVPADVDLLVVGGPTHAFGMSRPRTRADALRQPGHRDGVADVGVREWLEHLDAPAGGRVAAFDTRVGTPRMPGSAAHAIQRRLRHLGLEPAAPPESFWVEGTPGPLSPGELERAEAWGARLVGA